MSMISEALRKAQQQPSRTSQPAGSQPPLGSFWVLAVAVILVGSFVYWAWPKHQPAPRRTYTPKTSTTINTITPTSPAPTPKPILSLVPSSASPLAPSGWRVDGVITGGAGRPAAIINGELVQEGGQIAGAKLVRVNTNEIELDQNGEPVKVSVNKED